MNKKAIALLSGGIDSTLAIRVLKDQGIEIEAINFISPFCTCDRKGGCKHEANNISELLGIPLKVFATGKEYIDIIKHPKFGYGKNLNPCIDCRIFMLNKAKKYMIECNAQFLVTGEVLGQRPKSQRRDALHLIERETGLKGLILRPLSAKLLPPTIPEEKGIVDRKKLLSIKGRSRKEQFSLAKKYKLDEYLCTGGGCLLTDKHFVVKVKDLFKYKEDSSRNLLLLRIGRHFRSSSGQKIIVGKDKEDNLRLEKLAAKEDTIFNLVDQPGPLILVPEGGDKTTYEEARGLCIYFSKAKTDMDVMCKYKDLNEIKKSHRLTEEKIKELELKA
ncbi:MAG: hypothetical protein HY934_09500 [Candidatus Firestonebacteria bacterium]|nr:hypothetical protein [Candidatus Firestonebacteria bacterium]